MSESDFTKTLVEFFFLLFCERQKKLWYKFLRSGKHLKAIKMTKVLMVIFMEKIEISTKDNVGPPNKQARVNIGKSQTTYSKRIKTISLK